MSRRVYGREFGYAGFSGGWGIPLKIPRSAPTSLSLLQRSFLTGCADRTGEKVQRGKKKADQKNQIYEKSLPMGGIEGRRHERITRIPVVKYLETESAGSQKKGEKARKKESCDPAGYQHPGNRRGESGQNDQEKHFNEGSCEKKMEISRKEHADRLSRLKGTQVGKEYRGNKEGYEKRASGQEDQYISVKEPENTWNHEGLSLIGKRGACPVSDEMQSGDAKSGGSADLLKIPS